MDATKVEHELAIYIEPEVVIARELKDDVVTPVVLAIGRLGKVGLHLHAKEVVCFVLWNQIELFTLARIGVGELVGQHVRLIGNQVASTVTGIETSNKVVVRHKLAVSPRFAGYSTNSSQLVIDGKGSILHIEVRKV